MLSLHQSSRDNLQIIRSARIVGYNIYSRMDVIFRLLYIIPNNFDTSTNRHHAVMSLYVTQITIYYKIFKLKKIITMITLSVYLSI